MSSHSCADDKAFRQVVQHQSGQHHQAGRNHPPLLFPILSGLGLLGDPYQQTTAQKPQGHYPQGAMSHRFGEKIKKSHAQHNARCKIQQSLYGQ